MTGYSNTGKEIQVPRPPQKYGQPKRCFEPIQHAFLFSNGTMTDLGTLGGDYSEGLAINDSGKVVGWSQTKAGTSDAFLWNGTKMTDLGALSQFYPHGINDSGQIAGTCNQSFPCVDSTATFTTLPDPPGLTCGGPPRSTTTARSSAPARTAARPPPTTRARCCGPTAPPPCCPPSAALP